jgi:hypothetical protein
MQSKFIQGRFCSNCGRPLKADVQRTYRKASEVAREIIEEAEKIFMATCINLEAYTDWQNFKKKYTEGEE